eukprot:6211726-Pleurochrysis_carterae.AAC.3
MRTAELNEFDLFHYMAKPPKPQSPDEVALQAAAAPAFAAGGASSILPSPGTSLFEYTPLNERILEGETQESARLGIFAGYDIDIDQTLCHRLISIPFNYSRRYDWLEWPFNADPSKEALIYDASARAMSVPHLLSELQHGYLSTPYGMWSQRRFRMGRFDEHCRGLVDRSLKSASSMNPHAFDSVMMASASQVDLAHADAAWKCGRYYAVHVAPWANAAGATRRLLPYTPVGFLTMVALPTLHSKGIGRPPFATEAFCSWLLPLTMRRLQ